MAVVATVWARLTRPVAWRTIALRSPRRSIPCQLSPLSPPVSTGWMGTEQVSTRSLAVIRGPTVRRTAFLPSRLEKSVSRRLRQPVACRPPSQSSPGLTAMVPLAIRASHPTVSAASCCRRQSWGCRRRPCRRQHRSLCPATGLTHWRARRRSIHPSRRRARRRPQPRLPAASVATPRPRRSRRR